MQNGESARSTQRLMAGMLRPENRRLATAQAAITWSAAAASGADAGPARPARGAAGAGEARRQARAKAALPRVLPGRHRDRRRRHPAGAPRQGCVRQDLRSSDGDRSRRQAVDAAASSRWSAPTACCARTWPKRNGGFYTENEFDIASLIERHRRLALSRTRPILRAAALPHQAHRRTAVARRSGAMSASTGSTS